MADRVLSRRVRRWLIAEARAVPGRRVAVALSRGVDSTCVLLACLKAGKKVTAYSFTPAGTESEDFLGARETAKHYGLEFRPVFVSVLPGALLHGAWVLVNGWSCWKKTQVEAGYPMLVLLSATRERRIVTGTCGDEHYGLRREVYFAYAHKDTAAAVRKLDSFKKKHWADPNTAQVRMYHAICTTRRQTFHPLWWTRRFHNLFLGHRWSVLNKPHKQQISRDAFPEIEAELPWVHKAKHSDLHAGDGDIKGRFHKLLHSRFRIAQGHKTPVTLYRALKGKTWKEVSQ